MSKKTEFFSQFSWAMPHGFADALRYCQFGAGDILYQKKSAYQEEWDAQLAGLGLQVLYPPRQLIVPTEDTSAVFKKNWNSEVRVQKYSCKTIKSQKMSLTDDPVTTTQGRLYTSVWTGNLEVLNIETEEPLMPTINGKEAVRFIQKAEEVAIKKGKGKTVFVLPYDRSNNISTFKFSNILETLKADLSEKPILLTAKQAGIDEWKLFLPTIDIALFITPKLSRKALHDKVKSRTYVRSKNRKTTVDSYDIKKHGQIFC